MNDEKNHNRKHSMKMWECLFLCASSFRSSRILFVLCVLSLCLCRFVCSLLKSREMSWDIELDDQILQDLYAWIDQIPLSRPKKRIEKDFSDGGKTSASVILLPFICTDRSFH